MSSRPLLSRPGALRAVAGGAATLLAVLALTGCTESEQPQGGGYFDSPGSSQKATGASRATKTAAPRPTPAPKVPTSTKTVDVELNGSDDVAVVKSFNAQGYEGVDRFEVAFTKPISGYTLRYVDELTQDPSDKPVKLQGGAVLQLIVRGATTDNTPYVAEGTKPTVFPGKVNFKPRMLAIKEVREAGDFEATLTFGLGVAKKLPFRVTMQKDPTRLVVDIKQP